MQASVGWTSSKTQIWEDMFAHKNAKILLLMRKYLCRYMYVFVHMKKNACTSSLFCEKMPFVVLFKIWLKKVGCLYKHAYVWNIYSVSWMQIFTLIWQAHFMNHDGSLKMFVNT